MNRKSLTKSDCFGITPFERLAKEFNNVFGEFFGDGFWNYTEYSLIPTTKGSEFPKINILESNNTYSVEIAVAGFDKDDISLTLKDNQLIVAGEVKQNVADDSDDKLELDFSCYNRYIKKEISHRSFNRVIGFPKRIDENSCDAKYDNGIIIVLLNKLEKEEKPDSIKIDIN